MSCLITKGRLEPCKDKFGGLYKVFFANNGVLTGITYNADSSVSGFTGGEVFEYELKGTSNFTQSMASSRDAGTTAVTQTLTLSLKGLDASTNNEIKLLAYGRPLVIVQDNNGNAWLMGKDFGAELTTSESVTGTVPGDPYAYTLTLVAVEKEYANQISGATLANVFAGVLTPPEVKHGS